MFVANPFLTPEERNLPLKNPSMTLEMKESQKNLLVNKDWECKLCLQLF